MSSRSLVTLWLTAALMLIACLMGVCLTFIGCAKWGGCDYPEAPHRTTGVW